MKLGEIKKILNAKEILKFGSSDKLEMKMACGSDLMSDVLAFAKKDSLLLTGLTNPQVIRTAEMADTAAICFVRGKKPGIEIIALSKEKKIPLLSTHYMMFEACGKLFLKGLKSCS